MDTDDYDRLMGISSVDPSGNDGSGNGELTETEWDTGGVAIDSQPSAPIPLSSDACPGVDGISRGPGSASLVKVLNLTPSLAAPAACASELSLTRDRF